MQINDLSTKLIRLMGKTEDDTDGEGIIKEFLQWIDGHGANGVQFGTRFSKPESIESIHLKEWSKA